MYSVWAPLLVAGVVSAAQRPEITLPPSLRLPMVNVANVGACSIVAERALDCFTDFGGSEEDLFNADVDELLACACCDGTDNLASAYSACSTYMTDEMPSLSTDADAYGSIYPLCSLQTACSSATDSSSTDDGGDDDDEESGSSGPSITATGSGEINPSATNTDIEELTSGMVTDVPTACLSVFGAFSSCTRATPGFENMPYIEQAPCYCCVSRGDNVWWTDDIDEYASTCADWAVTGEPDTDTYFPVASTFASFCKNFSNVCEDATSTSEPTSEPTDDDDDTENNDDETTTETEETGGSTATEEDPAEESGSGALLRVSVVTAVATLLALLIVW